MPFLARDQVLALGFARVGVDVQISDRAAIHNPARIALGDRTRIDDFCVLSAGEGGIQIGRNVHLACMVTIIGKAAVALGDYSGLSGGVAVYSSSDDFSGRAMTNPTVPAKFTAVRSAPVDIGRHVIVGARSVILPGVTIGEGAAIGALSMVLSDCLPFTSYRGNPAVAFLERRRDLLRLAEEYERSLDCAGQG